MTEIIRTSLGSNYHRGRASGEGYEIFLPDTPNSADNLPTTTPKVALFREMGAVTERLLRSRSLLVWGEPGEGKSHLRDDMTMAGAAANDVPFLMVSFHINGSKETGPLVVKDRLKQLRDSSDESKLVVLDNVDYIGYKGKHRTRTRARDYAKQMWPVMEDILDDDSLLTLGFIHDEDWRSQRWAWSDPDDPRNTSKRDAEIYTPANKILNAFDDRYEFEGWLTDFGLEEVVEEAGGDQELLEALQSNVALKRFFYARHLDPATFKHDPEKAIDNIKRKRQEMKTV